MYVCFPLFESTRKSPPHLRGLGPQAKMPCLLYGKGDCTLRAFVRKTVEIQIPGDINWLLPGQSRTGSFLVQLTLVIMAFSLKYACRPPAREVRGFLWSKFPPESLRLHISHSGSSASKWKPTQDFSPRFRGRSPQNQSERPRESDRQLLLFGGRGAEAELNDLHACGQGDGVWMGSECFRRQEPFCFQEGLRWG